MALPRQAEELINWLERRPRAEQAAMTLRMILRGLGPLFAGKLEPRDLAALEATNLALVHVAIKADRPKIRALLERFRDPDPLVEAGLSVSRLKKHQATAARRTSRASSLEDRFAEGILDRAAVEANQKVTASKSKSRDLVGRAMTTLSVNALTTEGSFAETVALIIPTLFRHELDAFWASAHADQAFLHNKLALATLFATPLWVGEASNPKQFSEDEETFPFWRYWYRGFLVGQPLDWELLKDVALLKRSSSTLADFNSNILFVESKRLIDLAFLPERVAKDSTGLFTLINDPPAETDIYVNALRKVRQDIDRIRARSRLSNAYSALGDVMELLENVLAHHSDQPIAVHDDFNRSLKIVLQRLERQELPPGDDYIETLIDDLNNGAIDIRAGNKDVARAVSARVNIKKRAPTLAEAQSLAHEVSSKASLSDEDLARQLKHDASVIQELDAAGQHPSHPEPEQAIHRLAHRLPQMQDTVSKSSVLNRTVETAEKADKLHKGTEAVGAMAKSGWTWLQFLISLF